MPSEVILPRVDMDMATGKISKWLAAPGTLVAKGQPLFEIETDKAAMEIEAPAGGTLRMLIDASGADIPVGSTVAWIYAEGEEAAASPSLPLAERDTAAAVPPSVPAPNGAGPRGEETIADPGGDRPRATPLARRLARVHGIDLGTLAGSGPRGRIQAADIERAGAGTARTAAVASPDAMAPSPAPALRPAAVTGAAPLNIVTLRDGSGTPTLLVHGFGAEANGWRPFLAGRHPGHLVVALDLPGHGASPLGTIACFADLVDTVEAALARAGLGAVHVVAHSLGAATMAAVAARHALDIRSLLLLSPAGLGPAVNGSFVTGYLGAISEASLTPWMHELVADPAVITPAFVRATLKSREGTGLVESQRRVAEAVFPDGTQAFSIRGDLARLAMPTRVVVGGADRILPLAQAKGLPGPIAMHHFAQVGHMPHFEARDAIVAIAAQMAREAP